MKSHTHTQQGTFNSGGPSTNTTNTFRDGHHHSISHSHNVTVALNAGKSLMPVPTYGGFPTTELNVVASAGVGEAGVSGSTTDISTSVSSTTTITHGHSLSNHTHSTTISGQTSSNDSGATETRPKNYTYIIWRRIA